MSTTINQLRAERDRITKRMDQRYKANEADNDRRREVDRQIHRLEVAELLNVESGVRMGYRVPAGHRQAKLNDLLGTVKKIGRTRATVNFGECGNWEFPIADLKPAAAEQATLIPM